jgi:phosphoadenosine phosphosulfate reductase
MPWDRPPPVAGDFWPPQARARLDNEDNALDLIRRGLTRFGPQLALVSSFGAESAVLLDLVARVDPGTPVIFLDTLKLFGETLDYRRGLVARLGLTDVRDIQPAARDLTAEDPVGTLWRRDPDRCCRLRKVLPLERALEGFDAWFTGRKQHHGGERSSLPAVEFDGRRTRINPLANWSPGEIGAYFAARDLPKHPLSGQGYLSIGCEPCTEPVKDASAGPRSGRWNGRKKTECGIHAGYWDKAGAGG